MLEQLVKELRAGGTFEINSLANRLDTSPQVVAAMIEHLQRSGLVKAYINCGEGCGACSLNDSCSRSRKRATVRLWESTASE